MALDFEEASGEYVDFGSPAGLDDLAQVTYMAWVNLEGYGGGGFGRIFDKTNKMLLVHNTAPANLASFGILQNFSGGTGWWCTPTNSILTGTWYHVAATYDDSSTTNNAVLYINGVSQTVTEVSTPSGTRSSDAAAVQLLGNWVTDATRAFDGIMQDLRVYNRLLSANEILNEYNKRGKHPNQNGLVLRALCDELSVGTTTPAGFPVDLGPNQYASTPVNTPTYAAGQISPRRRVA